jgi:hypothetical protein
MPEGADLIHAHWDLTADYVTGKNCDKPAFQIVSSSSRRPKAKDKRFHAVNMASK